MFRKKIKKVTTLSEEIGKLAFEKTAYEILGIDFNAKGSDLTPAFNSFAVQIRLMRNSSEKEAFYEAYARNLETIKQSYLYQNPDAYYHEFLSYKADLKSISETEYIIYPTLGSNLKDIIRHTKELLSYYQVKKDKVTSISFDFNEVRIIVTKDSTTEELVAYYNTARKIKTYA